METSDAIVFAVDIVNVLSLSAYYPPLCSKGNFDSQNSENSLYDIV